jgi:hypothetical protein
VATVTTEEMSAQLQVSFSSAASAIGAVTVRGPPAVLASTACNNPHAHPFQQPLNSLPSPCPAVLVRRVQHLPAACRHPAAGEGMRPRHRDFLDRIQLQQQHDLGARDHRGVDWGSLPAGASQGLPVVCVCPLPLPSTSLIPALASPPRTAACAGCLRQRCRSCRHLVAVGPGRRGADLAGRGKLRARHLLPHCARLPTNNLSYTLSREARPRPPQPEPLRPW